MPSRINQRNFGRMNRRELLKLTPKALEGVSLDEEENKMGMKGSSTRAVIYTDVKVPVGNLIGEVGRGHIVALNVLNMARFQLGAGMALASRRS